MNETRTKESTIRLNKYIAHAGVCSRRRAEEFIAQGKVTINEQVVTDPAYGVAPDDHVCCEGQPLKKEKCIYLLLNKPKGYVTTVADEKNRATVMDLLGTKIKQRVFPVGRLDRDTTGLLLLTNDGDLAQKLAHPRHRMVKNYKVTLTKPIMHENFQKLLHGLYLPDGFMKVDRARYTDKSRKRLLVEVHSGRNRIIRRLFKHIGCYVKELDRVSYANINKSGLPKGRWRLLSKEEIALLKK